MVMYRPLSGLYQSVNEIELNNEVDILPFLPHSSSGNFFSWSSVGVGVGENPHANCEFNDVALKYISQILMEEDIEEKSCMLQESLALQATEKSFYDVIGKNYPPWVDHDGSPSVDENHNSSFGGANFVDVGDVQMASQSTASSFRSPNSAHRFLPNGNDLFVGMEKNLSGLFVGEETQDHQVVGVRLEKKHPNGHLADRSKGKKNSHSKNLDEEEERITKQSAISDELLTVRSEMLDRVLLSDAVKGEAALRESLQNETSKNAQHQEPQPKRSNAGKSRGRKKCGKKGVVDLSNLLTLCAEAIVAGDQRSAEDQLKQIRQHSSAMGDGMQRMAHYFANGLEARMAGTGTQIYQGLFRKKASAAEILKAYHLFLAICPFKKLLNFFSNTTIRKLAEKADSLHIVDFGISYGFQWPSLIQCLSSRPGGPPKLRITGIDLPQAGFRPAERVQETGSRLENYARSFNVPFEFKAIAQKWETIQAEDLKIETGDVLVVNCHCRFRNLLDETVMLESPRDTVFNLIRKLNPDVFILGIVNGSYGVPFFRTRFREALFHFSALFDMLDHMVPRDRVERTLIEREFFGWEAMNVIACEGLERIERPESYRQWQFRNMRAGFMQLPLDQEIVSVAKEKQKLYHKDFILDEDGQWLLQGWKGRMLFAMSCWKPA